MNDELKRWDFKTASIETEMTISMLNKTGNSIKRLLEV
jgi:hypothetical protein